MSVRRIVYFLAFSLFLAGVCNAQNDAPEAAVGRFLPPNTRLAKLVTIAPETFKPIKSEGAVLGAHILTPGSNDIVFAYYTPPSVPDHDKALFVAFLHETPAGFVKLYEFTYYGRLLMRDVSMPGIKRLRLSGDSRDSIAVYTGIGASLGGQLQVFQWREPWGLVNVMPENGSVHRVSFDIQQKEARITLSFEKYPGEEGVPPPQTFRWNGDKFVKVE